MSPKTPAPSSGANDSNATELPSAETAGRVEPALTPGTLLTRSVCRAARRRVKTSSPPLPSPPTSVLARDWNATTLPSCEIDGAVESPSP